jgi:hypothetical protein
MLLKEVTSVDCENKLSCVSKMTRFLILCFADRESQYISIVTVHHGISV